MFITHKPVRNMNKKIDIYVISFGVKPQFPYKLIVSSFFYLRDFAAKNICKRKMLILRCSRHCTVDSSMELSCFIFLMCYL